MVHRPNSFLSPVMFTGFRLAHLAVGGGNLPYYGTTDNSQLFFQESHWHSLIDTSKRRLSRFVFYIEVTHHVLRRNQVSPTNTHVRMCGVYSALRPPFPVTTHRMLQKHTTLHKLLPPGYCSVTPITTTAPQAPCSPSLHVEVRRGRNVEVYLVDGTARTPIHIALLSLAVE